MRRYEAVGLAVAAAGVALRLWALDAGALVDDAAWYAWMARSLLEHGEFLLPDGSGHTHHFPPLFPAYLAAWFLLLGPKVWVVGLAIVVAAAGFVATAYATTRDLYGREAAAVAAAFAGAFPFLLHRDAQGLSETFVALLFTATIWAILRSLKEPRFILLGGLFAGLGYLAKASMGPFFVFAGLAGLAWRFAYVRWRVLRDGWYLGAAAVFATLVLAWVARNWARHRSLDSQPHATESLRILFDGAWFPVVATSQAWSFFLLGCFVFPFLPWVLRSLRRIRDEHTSALWMAVVTPTVVAAFFVAAFTVSERSSITGSDLVFRYIMTPVVPLLWLALREADLAEARPEGPLRDGSALVRRQRALLAAGALVLLATFALAPVRTAVTAGRVLATLAGLVAGLALVAAARAHHWAPAPAPPARRAREPGWSATRERAGWAGYLAAAVAVAAAFLVPGELTFVLFGAAACLLVPRPRERALLFVGVLLAVSMSGTVEVTRLQTVADEVAAAAAGGATVLVIDDDPFLPPFLPDGVARTQVPAEAGIAVVMWEDVPVPRGYERVATVEGHTRALPGTAAERWIERALGLDPPPLPAKTSASVFRQVQ